MKKFRILLIDDTREVLDNLRSIIQRTISVESSSNLIVSADVTVDILHIVMEELPGGNGIYQIADQTIDNLAMLCHEKFDFIISDFAFIGDKGKNENLRKELLDQKRKVNEDDLKGWVLHLRDIRSKVDGLVATNPEKYNFINANFFENGNIIHVYSNSPEPFASLFDSYEFPRRRHEVETVFKNAKKVEFILMHDEFSINADIDNVFSNVADRKRFYSLLLSKRLNSLIETIILKSLVISQSTLKYIRANIGYGRLIRLGLALGAFSALVGEMLFHFLSVPYEMAIEKIFRTPEHSFNFYIFGGSLALFMVLLFSSYYGLKRFAVYVAKKTEDNADALSSAEE